MAAVTRQFGLGWKAIDGVKPRAVRRGLARRTETCATARCVDETAFKKHHDYVTLVSDPATGAVMPVAADRKAASLAAWYESLDAADLAGIRSVSMDMWPAFITATRQFVPDADQKIAFDRFHIAKHLGAAVDKVRRSENKALWREGDTTLKGSKYKWLQNPANMSNRQQQDFKSRRDSALMTARAYALKELAPSRWNYVSRTLAEQGWQRWLS